MARKKISEFRAKTILYKGLNIPYTGVEITPETNVDEVVSKLDDGKEYVVKVDQGVKKRGKQGLVKVGIRKQELGTSIEELKNKGFDYFIVEEFVAHDQNEERYLAIERVREGLQIHFSEKGGVNIEENQEEIEKILLCDDCDVADIAAAAGLDFYLVKLIHELFDRYYFSFLELNPYLEHENKILPLDAAVEVDSASEFFVDGAWTGADFRSYSKNKKTPEEIAVAELADKSQASFSLTVLNPNGSLFMLLSGGGASIVLADEAYNQGKGEEVANYGEYSGNPNLEETYLYTKEILSLLFNSTAPKKVLVVAGGVANFTDVRVTFKGVIKAIAEDAEKLREQNVKVFVRRGGPNQAEGLKMMADFLKKEDLYGEVEGPDKVLTSVVDKGLEYIQA